jgi:hypothetical protein
MTEPIERGTLTPEEHLATHDITLLLKKLGVTDEQLKSVQFWLRREHAFDLWPVTRAGDIPPPARPLIRAYCTLKWLILENPASSRDRDDAWRLVGDTMAAPIIEMGRKHKAAQGDRAQKPRVKITDTGQTMGQVVEQLALNPQYCEESPLQLWRHFHAELDRLDLGPFEEAGSDLKKNRYVYDFMGKKKSISYGQFVNLVRKARKSVRLAGLTSS